MDKVVVISGATSGIGLATVEKFIKEGWITYGMSRHAFTYDNGANHMVCDVTDETAVNDCLKAVFDKEGRIDVMVCNAGFGISGTVEFTEVEDAKRIFDVNFFGGLRCAKTVAGYMRAQGSGKIIFTSSVAAVMPIPYQGFYSATKGAINMMAGALRNEIKDFGVQVCAVMPGDVKTGFTEAREKSVAGFEIYGKSIEKSVSVMEHDEENGMKPSQIAAVIYKVAMKKRVKPLYTPGIMYKGAVFLGKILPVNLVYFLIRKIYVKK